MLEYVINMKKLTYFAPVFCFLMFLSSSCKSNEDVVVLFRGIHKTTGYMVSPVFKEQDARSPAAFNLSNSKLKSLSSTLCSLYSETDTLNHPPAFSLLHGMAQQFVNNYYPFRNAIQQPKSDLYKILGQHCLDVDGHFFVSTSLSVEPALRFAAGNLFGAHHERTVPMESEETCVGWLDIFVISQSNLMRLKPIVVNEGYALGDFNVCKEEFLRATEVLFLGYISSLPDSF
jgi:hypothetical protein